MRSTPIDTIDVHSTPAPAWSLLSNHARVLVCIADDPDIRLRDIALRVGLTERSVFALMKDLQQWSMIDRTRVGRRNRYSVTGDPTLPHVRDAGSDVVRLLRAVVGDDSAA